LNATGSFKMAKETAVSIAYTAKGKLPRLPFVRMKDAILGKKYELSIACVPSAISRKLNRTYRKKDKPTNILSFPLSKNGGELVLDVALIKHEAPAFGLSYRKFAGLLLIHGMLHLKGMQHGSTMESKERKFLKKFELS